MKVHSFILYLCVFLFSFSLFRIAAYKENQQLKSAAEGLLRDEYTISNPYLISKSLMDLKALGIFRCFTLTDDKGVKYVSDLFHPQCQLSLLNNEVKLNALNGRSYEFTFQKPLYPSLLIEIILTLLALVVTYFYLKFRAAKEELIDLKLNMARKISHDIRSPLQTMKRVIQEKPTEGNAHTALQALERLEDIANDLLDQTKVKSYENISFKEKVEQILTESEIKYPNVKVQILGDIFCLKPYFQRELLRGISNALQNSIEAQSLSITIKFSQSEEKNVIEIKDDGQGAPLEIIEKLGQGEISTKKNGNGIGVLSFSNWLKENGGQLFLKNEKPGLVVTAEIPSTAIVSEVVLLDNDPLVQFNWKTHAKKKNIELTSFNNFNDLSSTLPKISKDILMFIDFELEDNKNGLERIQQLKKKGFKNLYLCTSHRDIQTEVPKVDKGFPL